MSGDKMDKDFEGRLAKETEKVKELWARETPETLLKDVIALDKDKRVFKFITQAKPPYTAHSFAQMTVTYPTDPKIVTIAVVTAGEFSVGDVIPDAPDAP